MVISELFNGGYRDKTVLITGHTGFKGSWLALWLTELGAKVVGYSLPPVTEPNHYRLLNLDIDSIIADIRDRARLFSVIKNYQPDIIFHLAAQPLVRHSYKDPFETFDTNVMGTINLLDACRKVGGVKAIINVTSDKCYENHEWVWGYRENDRLGGYDPYSASKACSELATECFRSSFFNLEKYRTSHNTLLASVRAGNVVGGGDWAEDRLVPDIARSVEKKERVVIRNPYAVRPWQHVLEPLSGYLFLGSKLLEGNSEYADAWNFGPADNDNISVEEAVCLLRTYWPEIYYENQTGRDDYHEAAILKLDCMKARTKLRWRPVWESAKAFEITGEWYKAFYGNRTLLSIRDLHAFIRRAEEKKEAWTSR